MKKIIKLIKIISKKISKFIDKKIILPITSLTVKITSKFKADGIGFEKTLSKKNGLIIMSLISALMFFVFVDSRATNLVETSAEVIYNQPIKAIFNDAAYVIEGLPESVDITLVGRRSDLYLAKQLPTNQIEVDLRDLKPGVHKVNLKYKKATTSVEYKLDPSIATIIIYDKISVERDINTEIINTDKIDSKLIINDISLERDRIFVKGKEASLTEVASIKALVDLANLIDPSVGSQKLNDIVLVAYNKMGQALDVELVPSKVSANIVIASPSKVVPLKIIPKGSVVFGKAISTMDSDVESVTIYGKTEALDKIKFLPINIDVDNLKDDREYNLSIKKSIGINYVSSKTVNVKVTLGEEVTKEISDIYLEYINLDDSLSVQAIGAENTKVTIIVKGVADVIDGLDTTKIKAYVDLKNIKEGEHKINVLVDGEDLKVKYQPKNTKVTLKITQKN